MYAQAYSSPTHIPGCTLWLDGKDPLGTGSPPSNGALPLWKDKSGQGNHAIVAVGNPLFATDHVVFNGSTYMDTTLHVEGSTRQATYFIIFSTTIVDTNIAVLSASATQPSWGIVWTPTFICAAEWSTWGAVYNIASRTTPYVVSNTVSGSAYTCGVDGGSLASATVTTPVNTTNYLRIAKGYGTMTWYLTGNIYEVVAYDSVLSTANRQTIEGYLAWKYGLVGSLDPNHPWKKTSILPLIRNPTVPRVTAPIVLQSRDVFYPTAIAGCALWLDGKDPLGTGMIPGNGTTLAAWKDKSGNVRHATGSTNIPSWSNNEVNFTGSKTLTTTLSSTGLANAGTFFFIARINQLHGGSGFSAFFTGPGGGGGQSPNFYVPPGGTHYGNNNYTTPSPGAWEMCDNTTGNGATGVAVSLNNLTLVTAVVSALLGRLSSNGGDFSVNPNYTLAAVSVNYSLGTTAAAYDYSGTLGEVVVYDNVLNDANRQRVEGYLAWKWGLVGSLPAGHPYTTTALAYPIPNPTMATTPGQFTATVSMNMKCVSITTTPPYTYTKDGLISDFDAVNSASYPGTGDTWSNLIPTGPNITLYYSPVYNDDNTHSFTFERAKSQYGSAPSGMGYLSTFTIDIWHYFTHTGTNEGWPSLICQRVPGNTNTNFDMMNYSGGWRFFINYWQGGLPITFNTNAWNHIVFTYNNNTAKTYTNNVVTTATTTTPPADCGNAGFEIMSGWAIATSTGKMDGKIGSIRFYNRALTSNEVAFNYNNTKFRFGL